MLAQIHDEPFDDPEWIFEAKWDGYRAIAELRGGQIRLYSRNGLSFLRLYPAVAEELKKIRDEVVLDGEIVVLNESGRPDFQRLQQYDQNRSLPILYYVFDCLWLNGRSLLDLPLVERKKMAEKVLPKSGILRYSGHVQRSGVSFFAKVVEQDLEGMIAKRASSLYHAGKRTRDWLKIKNHNTQEAVIAGYTAPRGSRQYFGSLILGIYHDGVLTYIGHTGTGFTSAMLKEVHQTLKPLERSTSPFDQKVSVNAPVTWVEPKVVCAIKYTERTADGILRHPVFLGLRVDKAAEEVNTIDATVASKSKPAQKRTATKKPSSRTANAREQQVRVGSHIVSLTNLDKLYWPEEGITKGALIHYYHTISKYILPYQKSRPQSLRRNPNGIRDRGFFHKDAGGGTPAWVDTVTLYSEAADKDIEYILCNNTATLLYLNNLGCIELNPWNSRVSTLDNPDYLVIDLDPSDNNTFGQVIDAALVVREILDEAGAASYCKTSGASGLHVYVPLKARYTYDEARAFAEVVSDIAVGRLPDTTTTERSLKKRKGRIYIDYQQNKRGQTLASVYSVRPRPGATVSTPLLWKEVRPGLDPADFTLFNVEKRLSRKGDLFREVLTGTTDISKCMKKLGV